MSSVDGSAVFEAGCGRAFDTIMSANQTKAAARVNGSSIPTIAHTTMQAARNHTIE
jgi:hypothetical protein